MRLFLSPILLAAVAIATTTLTVSDGDGSSIQVDISTRDLKKWIDLSDFRT